MWNEQGIVHCPARLGVMSARDWKGTWWFRQDNATPTTLAMIRLLASNTMATRTAIPTCPTVEGYCSRRVDTSRSLMMDYTEATSLAPMMQQLPISARQIRCSGKMGTARQWAPPVGVIFSSVIYVCRRNWLRQGEAPLWRPIDSDHKCGEQYNSPGGQHKTMAQRATGLTAHRRRWSIHPTTDITIPNWTSLYISGHPQIPHFSGVLSQ